MNRFGVAAPGHPPLDGTVTSIAPAAPPPRRRGRVAALAIVLMVAAGAAGFGIAHLFAPGRPATVPVLAAGATVHPGAVLRASDLTVVALERRNLPPGSWLTASDEPAVVAGSEYAAVELPRGTLLSRAALTSNSPPPAGQEIIGLDLKSSQAPVQGAGRRPGPDAGRPERHPAALPSGTADRDRDGLVLGV